MHTKKGLAIIYDPHNLYQFVWYYCNSGHDKKKWDALCLPNAQKGEYMHSYCEASGIFDRIIRSDVCYEAVPIRSKLAMFVSMFVSWVFGRRRAYCRRLLGRFVQLDDYDEIVIIADVGVVSGACCALGKEKKVVILEDGINDYSERPKMIPRSKLRSQYSWQGFILAIMGYCSPGWFYLKTNRDCVKYASQPEKMIYRNYREIRQLYSKEGTDLALFDAISKRIYPGLQAIDFDGIDAALFTRPLDDYVTDGSEYQHRIERYIGEYFHRILIKKHPRESGEYSFPEGVSCMEVNSSVPAEAMLPYLKGKTIVIVTTSAISLYLKAFGLRCTILLFQGLYEESVAAGRAFLPLTDQEAQAYCEKFAEGCYNIVTL